MLMTQFGDGGPRRKSLLTAYLLLIVTGVFGGHRFYLRRWWSAVLQLLLTLTMLGLLLLYIGAFVVPAIALWLVVDALLLPRIVRQFNQASAER
jgi:TM2 domain-containing membrane protein YozV